MTSLLENFIPLSDPLDLQDPWNYFLNNLYNPYLTAPRHEWRGSTPTRATSHLSSAPHGCDIISQAPPSAWGGVGSSPVKLAHAQHQ